MGVGLGRIGRTLVAGILAGVKALALLTLGLLLGITLLRLGVQWYASGTFDPLPSANAASAGTAPVPVLDATPDEAKAIRSAVASMRYKLPPRAVTFDVTDNPACAECGGEYVPALDLIRIYRPMFRENPLVLRQAVAHEVGHYVDQHYFTAALRAEYKRMRGIPASRPWHDPNASWYQQPAEDFAEVFGVLNVSTVAIPPQTVYGPVRDPKSYERLLAKAGVRLAAQPTTPTWRSVLAEEARLLGDATLDPSTKRVWQAVILLYFGYYVLTSMSNAWHTVPSRVAATRTPLAR